MRKVFFGVAVSVLALGVAGAALGAPDFRDEKAVLKWMSDNKLANQEFLSGKSWFVIGHAPEGVWFSRRNLETTLNKNATLLVTRLELFEPIVDGGRAIHSISFDYEVNCRNKTMRRTVLTTYVKRKLTGSPVTEKVDEPFQPASTDKMLKTVVDEICLAADQPIPGNSRGQVGGVHGGIIIPEGR
jgi:hypothetical protein